MKAFLLVIILTTVTFHSIAQDPKGTNAAERKVLKMINSLPEVIKENQYRKKAHYKIFLKAFIQNTRTKDQDYYSVSISEDLGFQLRTFDWYQINPRTFRVLYCDFARGEVISLKAWRRQLTAYRKLKLRHFKK